MGSKWAMTILCRIQSDGCVSWDEAIGIWGVDGLMVLYNLINTGLVARIQKGDEPYVFFLTDAGTEYMTVHHIMES